MDIFEELDNDGNFFLSKNMSAYGKFKKKISIDDINCYSKRIKINSQRSEKSMKKLVITNKDLEYLTFKEYFIKNPELIGQTKEIQRIKYIYVEEIRKRNIEQIKKLRNEISEEDFSSKKRCQSSKIRGQNEYYNKTNQKNRKLSNSFVDKDIKTFNRMRNINKTELFNRMQIELKKELMKIINEEKEKKENEDIRKNQRILNKKMKIDNLKKLKEEEENVKREKEIAKLERKKEEKRIQDLIRISNEEEELLYNQKLLEIIHINKSKRKENEFKEKMKNQREAEYQMLLKKEKDKEKKAIQYKQELAKEKDELFKTKKKKLMEKRKIVEKNLKRMEYEMELKRIIYEENEKNKNEKKLK